MDATGNDDGDLVRHEWLAALADAGLGDDEVVLHEVAGPRSEGAPLAAYFAPGQAVFDSGFGSDLEHEIDADQNRHHVAIWNEDFRDPLARAALAARLRHELEHARQWIAHGEGIFKLDEVADHALRLKLGDDPNGSAFYQVKPVENDANAAASVYVRDRFPDQVDALRGQSAASPLLRSQVPPGDSATLVVRSVAFLFLLREQTREVLVDGGPAYWLKQLCPGAEEVWVALDGPSETGQADPAAGAMPPH